MDLLPVNIHDSMNSCWCLNKLSLMDRYKLYKYVYIHVWQWQTHWQVTSRDNIFLEPRQAVSPQNGNPHRQTLIYLHGLGGAPEGMLVLSPDGEKLLKVTFIEDWCWSVDFPIDVLSSFNYIGSGVDYLQADSELLWPWRLGASYAPGLRHLTPWVFDDHGFHGSRHCTDIRSRIPQRAPVTATLGRDGLVEPGLELNLSWEQTWFDGENRVWWPDGLHHFNQTRRPKVSICWHH